jgi:F-type H+-transporting ATPase subunit b
MELSLNPLDQIDPIVIGATVAIFALTYFTLRRVFVLPYLRVMEQRERMFEEADERADEEDRATGEAEQQAKAKVAEAREAADELLGEAAQQADAYKTERLQSATTTASERLEQGRAEIAQARESELARLREEAVDCVGKACDRLLGESDPAAAEVAVDRLLSRRVH